MRTLYYSPGAASFLVHWLLIELDLPHELVRLDLQAREQKSAAYLALNPNGTVPTLVEDGAPHYEAAALALDLAERDPQHRFAPAPGDPARRALLQWMFNLCNVVQPLFRQWWYPGDPAGADMADRVRAQVAPRIEAEWVRLDAQLAAHGPYLLGERPSVADFYLVMLMRWSRSMPRPATDWPALATLATQLKARPSFAALYASEGLSEWA
jgi:glutathione S-transferase